MDRSFWRRALQITAIFLALQLPALRSLAKYFPEPHLSVPIFLILAFCGTLVAMQPPKWFAEAMQKPWPAVLLVAAFTLVTLFVYPYADALKLQGAGSDADDALILSAQALIRLENPYSLSTYLGNPPAPGPGWAFLAIPFSFPGTYWLFFPSTLALALWRLRLAGSDWTTVNRFTILMASSLCVWELAAIGSDYLPFVMLVLIAFSSCSGQPSRPGRSPVLRSWLGCCPLSASSSHFCRCSSASLCWLPNPAARLASPREDLRSVQSGNLHSIFLIRMLTRRCNSCKKRQAWRSAQKSSSLAPSRSSG